MEPVWRLAESVSLSTEFVLAESFALAIAADDFVWSDFLGAAHYLNRIQGLTGVYSTSQGLTGVYSGAQRLEGGI